MRRDRAGAGGMGILFVSKPIRHPQSSCVAAQSVPRVGGRAFRERGSELPRHADDLPVAGRILEGGVGEGTVKGCSASLSLKIRVVVADDGSGKFR